MEKKSAFASHVLNKSFSGLDPRSTANLFSDAICTGEKTVNDEDCFVLNLKQSPPTLRASCSSNVEIIRHTIWRYFSQRTGLLVQLEDSHILRIKAPGNDVFWETTMESVIQDYRTIDGINIAHAGRTSVSLFRLGESSDGHPRTRMEEVWAIEEVDFNTKGLSSDCFLPPADLKKEDEECAIVTKSNVTRNAKSPFMVRSNSSRITAAKGHVAKIVAIDEDDPEILEAEEEL